MNLFWCKKCLKPFRVLFRIYAISMTFFLGGGDLGGGMFYMHGFQKPLYQHKLTSQFQFLHLDVFCAPERTFLCDSGSLNLLRATSLKPSSPFLFLLFYLFSLCLPFSHLPSLKLQFSLSSQVHHLASLVSVSLSIKQKVSWEKNLFNMIKLWRG